MTVRHLIALAVLLLAPPVSRIDAARATVCAQQDDLPARIDALAGHPDDPALPEGFLGASDQALEATNSRTIADLLQEGVPQARQTKTPRLLFALGRAALAHGYERQGLALLEEARQGGSAGACAYLAYAALERGDREAAADLLRRAITGGFEATRAKDALAELEVPASPGSGVGATHFRAQDFNRPDWIQALYDGKPAPIEAAGFEGLTYASGLQNGLWDIYMILLAQDPAMFLELDAHLSFKLGLKLATSESNMGEVMGVGAGSLVDMLTGMAETRREGGSLAAELSAMTSAPMKRMEPIAIAGSQAQQDARRLAILYGTDRAAFRKVYQGLRVLGYGPGGVARSAQQGGSGSVSSFGGAGGGRVRMATAGRAADDPVSMYERANAGGENSTAALFRINDNTAYLVGRGSASEPLKMGRIEFRRMKSHSDQGQSIPPFLMREEGVQMAMRYYARQFPNADAIVAAAESAPLRPTWNPTGPVRLAVDRVVLERRIDIQAMQRATIEGQPFFFCSTPDADLVYLHMGGGVIYLIYVEALQEHLSSMDRIIAKTGSYFGETREEHLAVVAGRGTASGIALGQWPTHFPDLERFLAAAAQASVRPELFREQE